MCSSVALQVEGVIEALSAKGAEVPLDVTVTLEVAVQQALQSEEFATNPTRKLGGVSLRSQRGHLLGPQDFWVVCGHWVLDPEARIDQFHGGVGRDAKLEKFKFYVVGALLYNE